jgi:hypothetical protein
MSLVVAGAALWLLVVCAGMRSVLSYAYTPGSATEAPRRWPSASSVRPLPGRATLVMLAHPQCPCTRASLGELEQIMAHLDGRIAATVLFYKPQGAPAGWASSDLWDKASRIPGVTAAWDSEGAEARRFGGATSGHVVVYDTRGYLLFSGGITASRGHLGDNFGRSAIVSAVGSGVILQGRAPVFGCSLLDARSRRAESPR